MRTIKFSLLILSSFGLLFLGACSGGTQTNTPSENSSNTTKTNESANSTVPETTKEEQKDDRSAEDGHDHSSTGDHSHDSKEVQEVQQGEYHLEFVTEKENNDTHLDISLHKGTDQSVSNANVIAQVQLPDGKQQQLELKYDEQHKHYTGILADSVTGKYQVKITADVNGEKISGRFEFEQQ